AAAQGQEIGAAFERNADKLGSAMDQTDARSKAIQATLAATEELVERQAALMRDVAERTTEAMERMAANLDRHKTYLAEGVHTINTTSQEADLKLEDRLSALRQLATQTADAMAASSALLDHRAQHL